MISTIQKSERKTYKKSRMGRGEERFVSCALFLEVNVFQFLLCFWVGIIFERYCSLLQKGELYP